MEAPQPKTARVLVVGDVTDLSQLQTKETGVMKQQEFDAVLCVGAFQPGAVKSINQADRVTLEQMPLPTYFFAPAAFPSDPENNIHFLGTNGVSTIATLQIAYVSDPTKFPAEALKPVDIVLLRDWPKELLTHVTSEVAPEVQKCVAQGQAMSELLHHLAPRYIFVAADVYYERLPWCNRFHNVGRFFALAPLNNPAKAKAMYAFGIVGIESTQNKAVPLPPLYTPDPFAPAAAPAAEQPDRRKRRREENIEGSRDCWFCLQNPNCDAHLVVSVGKENYVALAKGGIVEEHLLVIPIYHYPSVLSLPPSIAQETRRYIEQLVKMYTARDMNVCVFERVSPGLRDPHTQVNVVPIPKQYTADKISAALLSQGIASRISFSAVDADLPLEQLTGGDDYYFVFEIYQGKQRTRYLQRIQDATQHPMQFGREVLCNLLGAPERIDWRNCQLAKPQAMKLAAEFRDRFKPYDDLMVPSQK